MKEETNMLSARDREGPEKKKTGNKSSLFLWFMGFFYETRARPHLLLQSFSP